MLPHSYSQVLEEEEEEDAERRQGGGAEEVNADGGRSLNEEDWQMELVGLVGGADRLISRRE